MSAGGPDPRVSRRCPGRARTRRRLKRESHYTTHTPVDVRPVRMRGPDPLPPSASSADAAYRSRRARGTVPPAAVWRAVGRCVRTFVRAQQPAPTHRRRWLDGDTAAATAALSARRTVAGTAAYMAPEQAAAMIRLRE